MLAWLVSLALVTVSDPARARDGFVPAPRWRAHAGGTPQPGRDLRQPSEHQALVSAPRVVRIDVIATDSSGRTIENLNRADFELREDGTPQTIDEVRFIKADRKARDGDVGSPIASDADERAEASRSGTGLFAVFLDEYHVSAADSSRVRAAARQFVDESLGPQDLVAVMRPLDSVLSVRLTRDRDHARQEIERFEGRKDEYTPRNDYERNYIAWAPARVEQFRAQVTASALSALAAHLGSLDSNARKVLVVVSEGLPQIERRRGVESLPTLESVGRSANRSNVSIYPVDPRPRGSADGRTAAEDTLRGLAEATNGLSIATVADLSAGMRAVAVDSSAYYLLAFHSGQKPDGRFHAIQVSVTKPGVQVRAREGYWAAIPDEDLRAGLVRPRVPALPDLPRHISPLIATWFGASRGLDGKTRVTFTWEPAVGVPGDRARQASASRIVLHASAADGTSLFEGSVQPAGPRLDRVDEMPARAVFDAPPGLLRLRMSIEDEAGRPVDSDVREVSVRDLTAPIALGTPQVLRARTARDFLALENDAEAVPVVAREFSRTERLLIRFPAYAPRDTPLAVSVRLLNRAGQAMRDLGVRRGTTATAPNQVDLPLAGLAAGQYFLEFSATSSRGDAKERLEFRVTN